MNDEKNSDKSMKKIKNKLLKKTLADLVIKIGIWTVVLPVFLFLLFSLVGHLDFQWLFDLSPVAYKSSATIFELLFGRSTSFTLFNMLVIWVIGDFVLLYNMLKKIFTYINIISQASGQLVDKNVSYIELPSELEEFQHRLNYLKGQSEASEKMAREAEQRKNDLVVYLAHDLKTPLTSVIGYLTLLHDEKQISEELREKYLSISLEKAERLEELINEFFEITRFNLSEIMLQYSRVNLTRMLQQLVFEFEPMLSEKNLKCKLESEQDIMIDIDADKMQRVFDNLLRNAVNYSFNDETVIIRAAATCDEVTISFINRGNTIPEEKLKRIFEQFYRLDTARSSSSGGAGLGLAISKEIVEKHNGSIRASSENESIEFDVKLPLS